MRRFIFAALLLALLLASCADPFDKFRATAQDNPQPAPTPTGISPIPTRIPHASEIRFALVGEPTDVNVWALFDEQGTSYANYALRNDYWPRLYYLAPPDLVFTPRSASGEPAPVTREGDFFTSTVTLRPDLKWTDGSPFTAEDVAFTVNAALQFELGFDWKSYYSPDYLTRAEAVGATTVKFYFKQKPNVGVWQYGALQGPVVQKEFWESRIKSGAALLPDDSLRASIADAQARSAEYQPIVDTLSVQVYILQAQGKQNRDLEAELKRKQGDLDEANNDLAKALAEYADKLESAHQALYALVDQNEPTLGVWMTAGKEQGKWINEANPDFPFERPNFDRAVYTVFEDDASALSAFVDNKVDVILGRYGIPNRNWAKTEPSNSARFLVFNPQREVLADAELHKAISCIISTGAMASGQEWAYDGFILSGPWQKDEPLSICSGLSKEEKIQNAVGILKAAGYSWAQEPTIEQPGSGLTLPDRTSFLPVTLLSTLPEYEFWRVHSAEYIELQAQYLGIPLTVQLTDPEALRYAVYSSGDYDMAILGWSLSAYPGYLCEWFQAPSPFAYNEDRFKSVCETLDATADLETARQAAHELQSILMEDLPFIPLYQVLRYEAYQNVTYPFDHVLNGLSGLYGAPSLAIPLQ